MSVSKRHVAIGLFVAAALGSALPALAGPKTMIRGAANAAARGPAVEMTAAHKLIKSYVSSGDYGGAALPAATFSIIDSRTVKCTSAAGCNVTVEAMVQLAPGSSGVWGVCTDVGDQQLPCPVQGLLPQGGAGAVVGHARGVTETTVPEGNHTVQTMVFTTTAGQMYAYQVEYRVYKP